MLDQLRHRLNAASGTSVNQTLERQRVRRGRHRPDRRRRLPESGTCSNFGNAFGVSRARELGERPDEGPRSGRPTSPSANCGRVIIRKVTAPAGDTTTELRITRRTSRLSRPRRRRRFDPKLKDGGSNTINNVVPASGRTVTEDDPSPGYALSTIDCNVAAHPSTVPAANISTNTTNANGHVHDRRGRSARLHVHEHEAEAAVGDRHRAVGVPER